MKIWIISIFLWWCNWKFSWNTSVRHINIVQGCISDTFLQGLISVIYIYTGSHFKHIYPGFYFIHIYAGSKFRLTHISRISFQIYMYIICTRIYVYISDFAEFNFRPTQLSSLWSHICRVSYENNTFICSVSFQTLM